MQLEALCSGFACHCAVTLVSRPIKRRSFGPCGMQPVPVGTDWASGRQQALPLATRYRTRAWAIGKQLGKLWFCPELQHQAVGSCSFFLHCNGPLLSPTHACCAIVPVGDLISSNSITIWTWSPCHTLDDLPVHRSPSHKIHCMETLARVATASTIPTIVRPAPAL